jgi:hypothetical protein
VRGPEALPPEPGFQSAPAVVDAPHPRLAAEQHLEAGGVARQRLGREGVEGAGKPLLEDGGPVGGGEAGIAGGDLLAEAGEGLGGALLPERILERQGEEDRLAHPGGEMADAGAQPHRPLAGIGEAPLGGDPQRRAGAREDVERGLEEAPGAERGAGLDADKAELLEEAVAGQGAGVDRTVGGAVGKELRR